MKALILLVALFAIQSWGIPLRRESQDLKLATQQLVEKQTITNPAAAGTTDILNADAGGNGSDSTVSTFAAQPDVARNVQLVVGGTAADVEACTVTLNGTNIFGESISEEYSTTLNTTETIAGNKAFLTVTSLEIPSECEASPYGATWSLGYGEKLGLKRCLDAAGHVVQSTVAGAFESTRATVAIDVDDIEGNTADFNGTMNGSNDFEIFFFQNFRCFP